ncbi:MAG: hypothetical protein JW953_17935 [Anaerolineae bacterium]|nr:hypothetical protein [Anaerolineae bacterium]
MSSKTTWLAVAFIIFLLTCNFFICGLLSYWGVGVQQVGPHYLRAGSVGGPIVSGGGPGSGK